MIVPYRCINCKNKFSGDPFIIASTVCPECNVYGTRDVDAKGATEDELYVCNMKHWFDVQERITEQFSSTIQHYEELASLKRKQLTLHIKLASIGATQYNAWAIQNGFQTYDDDLFNEELQDSLAKDRR